MKTTLLYKVNYILVLCKAPALIISDCNATLSIIHRHNALDLCTTDGTGLLQETASLAANEMATRNVDHLARGVKADTAEILVVVCIHLLLFLLLALLVLLLRYGRALRTVARHTHIAKVRAEKVLVSKHLATAGAHEALPIVA